MSIDIDSLRQAIGRTIVDEDVATAWPLRGMIATFDRTERAPVDGESIPAGWHYCYFNSDARPAELAEDGLPRSGGVLPKMPLPRRMYAGSTFTFAGDIRVGDKLRRETELTDLQLRGGGTGTLIVATQTRRVYTPRGLAVSELYNTVFREAVAPGAQSGIPKRETPPEGLPWRRTHKADAVSLFRYSALTFNPHRIHYDRPYAMQVEGYPGLVVHGPYSQQCVIDLLRDSAPGRRIATLAVRARAPLFDIAPFELVGRPTADGAGAELWALTPQGTIAVQASATFA